MKRFVLWIAFVFMLVIVQNVVYSKSGVSPWSGTLYQDGKVKIKKEDLPDPVKKTLGGDAYKGWVIVSVHKTNGGEYEVELKKGDTTQALTFDKNGKAK